MKTKLTQSFHHVFAGEGDNREMAVVFITLFVPVMMLITMFGHAGAY